MNEYLKKLFGDKMEVVDTLVHTEKTDILNLFIEREAIERGHLQAYIDEFKRLERKKGIFRSRIILAYQGYESDTREVYQIPEIRSWTSRLLRNIPHLFYFLSPEAYSIRVAFMCVTKVLGRDGERAMLTKKEAQRIIEGVVQDAVRYGKKVGDSVEEQFALATRIMKETGYDRTH